MNKPQADKIPDPFGDEADMIIALGYLVDDKLADIIELLKAKVETYGELENALGHVNKSVMACQMNWHSVFLSHLIDEGNRKVRKERDDSPVVNRPQTDAYVGEIHIRKECIADLQRDFIQRFRNFLR